MDFKLSEDHQLLSNSLRRFLADTYDIEKRNTCAFEAPFHMEETWAGLAELGTLGAFVTEDQGGFGGSAQDVAVIFEELGRGLCTEPVLGTLLGLRLLAAYDRTDLVERLIAGEARSALAVFEPNLTCDLSRMEANAHQQDGVWHLTGRKSAVYGAPGAEYVLATARTDAGIGLFLLENPDLISAAMTDGGGTAEVVLDDVTAECLSVDAGEELENALDLGRIALCAEAVGAMTTLHDMTADYLKQRRQFSQPLSEFQAIQHRVVDMLMELEQSRSIVVAAAGSFGGPDQSRMTAMAKNLIGRAGRLIAEEAIQLNGAIGMTWEYPGAHFAKRLIMIDHQLGDRYDCAVRLMSLNDRKQPTKAAYSGVHQ